MPKRSTLRLTTRSVAALPETGRDAVYWDGDLPGFGVRVQRNGRKVYVVQSRGPAGLKRVTLGPVAGKAIDQRRREAAEVIDRIKRGLDPIPPKSEPDPTVADLAARCHARLREGPLASRRRKASTGTPSTFTSSPPSGPWR